MFSLPSFPAEPSRYLDRRDVNIDSVIITPSATADVSATPISADLRSAPSVELSAFCAGAFLYTQRGLPNDEIEVETSEKNYRVARDQKNGKISIILPKCKVIYTNKRETVDEIDVTVSAYSYKNHIFKLTECKNSEHFSDANLRSILRTSLGDSVDGVAAYSFEAGEASVKLLLSDSSDNNCELYILLAVAGAVLSKCSPTCFTVKCKGGKIGVCTHGAELAVFDDELNFFTLSAPDII